MTENSSQVYALQCYESALSFFRAGHFAKALQMIREYRRYVDYSSFRTIDKRDERPGRATVIIITRDRGKELVACLDSLKNQQGPPFEVIVVDNGGKKSLQDALVNETIVLVECPVPFTPSEGRNIGAFHARTDLLIFLDDDALAEPGFVRSALIAFEAYSFLGIRGRILPKAPQADHSLAGLYDLGKYPIPALLDIEGNMAVPKELYNAVGGMNPLLFGAEGLDLTARLLEAKPDGDVYYWPGMVIRHNYASGEALLAKRKRQALVNEYFGAMHPLVLKVKARYTELYRVCRKENQGAFYRTLPRKIKAVGRDMGLALKSEKTLPFHRMHTSFEKNLSKPLGAAGQREISQKEAKALLQRVHELEIELEETRKSLTFRLGYLIRDALSSPLRQGFLLPVRLGRLIREYLSRPAHSKFNAEEGGHITGSKIRNQLQYTRPGREEHALTLFLEFLPFRKTRNSSLRIACILSPWMQSCLDVEAELIPLRLDNWQEVLQNTPLDFLLVQSLLEKSGSWQEYCISPDGLSSSLEKLMTFCNNKKIPTVFWDTEDHVHFPFFSKIAPSFDRVFAADHKSIEEYRKLLGREVTPLGPAVQPALHNPLKPGKDSHEGFTILLDGWADILEYPAAFEFLKPLFKEGLHIIESRYRLRANKLDDLPVFRENIMGCVSYGRRLSALRYYRVLIMPDKSFSSGMARSWNALEAIACGCSVVMSGRKGKGIPEGLVIQADDDLSIQEKALQLLKDDITRLRMSHLARRNLYAAHTYGHRVKTICESLGIVHDWEEFPLVSVVMPTKRLELIGSCLEKFHSQKYPNKELIIVVNTGGVDLARFQRMITGFSDVRIFQVHQEKNIGTCLNFGVTQARGKYWFKMDDDDFYGTNYLLDMVHLARAADFDIMGKPPGFIYLEEEDRIYLRDKAVGSQYTIGSMNTSQLCGATLGGRRDLFTGFSESHRACVDTDFVEDAKAMGQTVMFGDIWNFIAFRATDKRRHTWRHDDEGITEKASPFCKGLCLEKIMI
jgi:glycosyltransferase involved in cell wall biosynthesis